MDNAIAENAIAELKAAQSKMSKLFDGVSSDVAIIDITDENWTYDGNGRFVFGIEPTACEFSHDGAIELEVQSVTQSVGDYALVYASSDYFNVRVNNRWNNMAYYIVNKNKEIK